MMTLWPHWLRPFWLLLVPLLAWLIWHLWHRQQRAGRWQSLLPPAFHQVLLGGVSRRNSRLPWLALGLAWLLALLALLGPSWQRVEQVNLKRADPLVVVLKPDYQAAYHQRFGLCPDRVGIRSAEFLVG